jgi:pimeloyl-ACP methyl ester carboxylesterase
LKQKLTYKSGLELSYAEYGERDGYPILVQHGLIASIDDYDLFDRLIQQKIRLICVARPGYGDSSLCLLNSYAEWSDIVSVLIRELQLPQFDVLGISSGAPYAYSIGYKFPGQVGSIFILSGMPALYDDVVLSHWPYEPIRDLNIGSLEELAHQLFFSNLTEQDLKRNDIKDSLRNRGFGVAQDLRLRFMDWGFHLSILKTPVFMRHSMADDAVPFRAAVRTSELLPGCHLDLLESGPHFSQEVLDRFIEETILPNVRSVRE